jgi:hypothetical protein
MPEPGALAAPQGQAARHRSRGAPVPLRGTETAEMTVTIPLVVVIGVLVWVAWRFMGLRTWQAVMCLLLGFLLAATTAAPAIHRFITTLVRSLAGH